MLKTQVAWAVVTFVLMVGAISYLTYNFIMKTVVDPANTPLEDVNQTTPDLTQVAAIKKKATERCDESWEYIVLSDGHRFSIIVVFNLSSTVATCWYHP